MGLLPECWLCYVRYARCTAAHSYLHTCGLFVSAPEAVIERPGPGHDEDVGPWHHLHLVRSGIPGFCGSIHVLLTEVNLANSQLPTTLLPMLIAR